MQVLLVRVKNIFRGEKLRWGKYFSRFQFCFSSRAIVKNRACISTALLAGETDVCFKRKIIQKFLPLHGLVHTSMTKVKREKFILTETKREVNNTRFVDKKYFFRVCILIK